MTRKALYSDAAEYHAWESMVQRCTNPKHPNYADYGGRGVRVCEEWRNSSAAFLAYVGKRPSSRHSLDRVNNDGNYEPGNVRWVTWSTQVRNRRISRNPRRCIEARSGSFRVQIWSQSQRVQVGTYATLEDAMRARDWAEALHVYKGRVPSFGPLVAFGAGCDDPRG